MATIVHLMNLNELSGTIIEVAIDIHRLGLLMNFGMELLKDGISRVANEFAELVISPGFLREPCASA